MIGKPIYAAAALALATLQGGCSESPERSLLDASGADGLALIDTALDTSSGDDAHSSDSGMVDGQTADGQTVDSKTADSATGSDAGGSSGTVIPKAYITGYSWFDNTPPGSAAISHPQIHQTAGGTGTWTDPITMAVGHDLSSGQDVLDYPAGTRFYIPDFQRYFIVEDTCGDGPTPENGPCHVPPTGATTWLDVWIGGESGTQATTDACMNKLTGIHQVVLSPDANRPVSPGAIFSNGACQI
jgi:hypothetical protein